MLSLLEPGRDFLPPPGLAIQGRGFENTLEILRTSTVSGICTPAAFIPTRRWKKIGRTGAGTSILTDM